MVLLQMRRMQPAAAAMARSMARSGPRAASFARPMAFEHASKMAAVQLIPTHSFGGRSFSSGPVPGVLDDDKITTASPAEAVDQALEAAGNIEYASVSDLGYSLSDLAIQSLDVIHSTTGMPWWATIIATTIVARTACLPITIVSMRNAAKMKLFQPDMEKLKAEMDEHGQRDPESIKKFQGKYRALMQKHGVNPLLSFITPMAQIPLFLGFFWGLQNISKYFPEYSHEGVAWFKDLSVADPTMALPVISSALIVASVELGGDQLASDMRDKMRFGMRLFALAMIPLTMNFQSGIFVYWVTSNVFTVVQTGAMRLNPVKRALNIPVTDVQIIKASPTSTLSPFEQAVSRAKEGTAIKTHVYKPKNPKKNRKN